MLRGHLTATLWAGALLGITAAGPAAGAPVAALAPIHNLAGDAALVGTLEEELVRRLGESLALIEPIRVRDSLRRLRIRDIEATAPEKLRAALESMAADVLISMTLHDALRRGVPELTISARVYRGGELIWADFRSASGLDRRTVLGLRVDTEIESVATRLSAGLVRELEAALVRIDGDGERSRGSAPWALLPFSGLTARNGTANAETVTEAARAAALDAGVHLLSPNHVRGLLRRRRIARWDEINESVRIALLEEFGAPAILTGQVEVYESNGGREPEPRVSLAIRLIDTATGNVVWQEALERQGWDSAKLFGVGRVFAQGVLAERLVARLTRRLLESRDQAAALNGGFG